MVFEYVKWFCQCAYLNVFAEMCKLTRNIYLMCLWAKNRLPYEEITIGMSIFAKQRVFIDSFIYNLCPVMNCFYFTQSCDWLIDGTLKLASVLLAIGGSIMARAQRILKDFGWSCAVDSVLHWRSWPLLQKMLCGSSDVSGASIVAIHSHWIVRLAFKTMQSAVEIGIIPFMATLLDILPISPRQATVKPSRRRTFHKGMFSSENCLAYLIIHLSHICCDRPWTRASKSNPIDYTMAFNSHFMQTKYQQKTLECYRRILKTYI